MLALLVFGQFCPVTFSPKYTVHDTTVEDYNEEEWYEKLGDKVGYGTIPENEMKELLVTRCLAIITAVDYGCSLLGNKNFSRLW